MVKEKQRKSKARQCGPNQVFLPAGPCDTYCPELSITVPRNCYIKVPQCHCELGFVRQLHETCVRKDQCSVQITTRSRKSKKRKGCRQRGHRKRCKGFTDLFILRNY